MAGKTAAPKTAAPKAKAKMKAPEDHKKREPRVQPTAVTPHDEWLIEAEGSLMTLPSGKVVRVDSPGMTEFLKAGLIPNELMPIVMKSVDQADPRAASNEDLKKVMDDPQAVLKLAEAVDKIFCYCVTEPVFEMPPATRSERVPGTLYVDKVHQEDKTFVFQLAVGGTTDVEQFRAGQAEGMAALRDE